MQQARIPSLRSTTTGETHFVANFWSDDGSLRNFVDIAIDLNGRMYGGTYDTLYRIDPTNGCSTRICRASRRNDSTHLYVRWCVGRWRCRSHLDCGREQLHIRDSTERLYWETSGDLVGLPDGYLYWTVVGENGDDLIKLDPDSGMTQWVGETGYDELYGLGYDDDELLGFSAGGNIVAINPSKAFSVLQSTTQSISWWGATTNPVIW